MRWAHPGSIERWVARAGFGQDGDVGSEDNRILSAGGGRSGWRWWRRRVVRSSNGVVS